MTNNVYMHGIPKGKIIRDAVHGDIFVEDKFLKIIDTPEFQRMRRIKQLSVANIVFPSADHTRFSHSLGCFYVMKQIIAHFDSIFGKMGIEVSKQDKDIALLAALLHDIGHGPFSHAFEDIHPKGAAQVSHETWTSRIINKREIINILAKKSEAKFEMAFDHVTYQDDSGHKAYDYQIEIELKSDYIHRVNLKMLTDDLERKVSKLESSTESKYKRGLTKLSVQ